MRITRARWAHNAVPNAVRHMQFDDYDADRVEVYDDTSGTLFVVLRSRLMGQQRRLEIIYERKGQSVIASEKPAEDADK